MLFSSTSDFPLCLCLFFSMADLLLLMVAKYSWIWAHNKRILTSNSPNIKIHLMILFPWRQSLVYQTDKSFLLFSTAVRNRGWRNLFTLPILYFPFPPFYHHLHLPVCSQASAYGKDYKHCQKLQKPNGFPHPTRLDQTSLLTSVATGYYFTELTNFRWGAVIKRLGMETRSCLLMPQVFTSPPPKKINPNITTVAFQAGSWGLLSSWGSLAQLYKYLCVLE